MDIEFSPTWPPFYPRHRAVSAAESADIDKRATSEYQIPSLVLMEHAARGIARVSLQISGAAPHIICLCGPGNNGGDGYGAARFLRSWGVEVRVFRCAPHEPHSADSALQHALALEAVESAWDEPDLVPRALAEGPTLVIDALFGVGLARPLEGRYLDWVRALNSADTLRMAVDVPSGMDADSGAGLPECVQAHLTATMAAPKTGLLANPTATGQVVEIDIGLPAALHGEFLA